ncbi:MAG: hypothetical protein IJS14_03825 [Lentisphaeria bacterium]|nr:hypothetical protein [Lentisphaeria bacterium]
MDFGKRLVLISVDHPIDHIYEVMRRFIVHEKANEQYAHTKWHWCHHQNEKLIDTRQIQHKQNTGGTDQPHNGNKDLHVLETQEPGTGESAVFRDSQIIQFGIIFHV